MRIILWAALVALTSAGCASMSAQECLTADWRAIGYEDGARGASVAAVSPRRRACADKAGVSVDMAAYMDGRDAGLVLFCQPGNGYALGARGGAYNGVCAGPQEAGFIAAYESGRELHALERRVAGIEADIRLAHGDLDALAEDIAVAEADLVASDTPHEDRVLLLAKVKRLSEERGNIETAIIALNRDHVRAIDALDAYRAFIAANGPDAL